MRGLGLNLGQNRVVSSKLAVRSVAVKVRMRVRIIQLYIYAFVSVLVDIRSVEVVV